MMLRVAWKTRIMREARILHSLRCFNLRIIHMLAGCGGCEWDIADFLKELAEQKKKGL